METIKLDLIPGKKMPSLHASQYDDGREHGIDLFENGVAYKLDGTETLTINERKGDDCICSLDIENTFADSNHIVFASTEQMCAVWGNNICELVIAKGEKTIGTLNFILEVEPSPTEGGIESESEIKNLKRQIEAITEEVIGEDYYTAEETDEAIATAIEGKADKTYVDTELAKKANTSTTYTKAQSDNKFATISTTYTKTQSDSRYPAKNDVYTKTQAEGRFPLKNDVYTKMQSDGRFALINNTYSRAQVDAKIAALPEAMVFKGTLGVGGTVEDLPVASAENEGWTYKVITDGTYAGQTAKDGDMFTSNGSAWVYIPSGDEDNDTWRAIKVNGVEKLGNGISSGSLDVVDTDNIEAEFDNDGNKLKLKTKNIYTQAQVDAIVSDAIYNVLPDDTASGSIANFNTSLELPIKSLEVDVNAVQESGTPTPSSPKAISGWNAITLDANGTTEVINLGGTYYGGHFTQDKDGHRRFEVTWCDLTDLGSLPWGSASNGRIGCNPADMGVVSSGAVIGNIKSYCYRTDTQNNVYNRTNDKTIAMTNNLSTRMMLYDSDLGNKTSAEVKTALSGRSVIYGLLEPYIINLPDGEPINTLIGTNNIFADTGDTSVVFKSSVNDYVSAHSGGNLLGMGGVYLGGAKSGGSEEEPDEGEDTEKVKLDEPKEEVKTIGDVKKLGGD